MQKSILLIVTAIENKFITYYVIIGAHFTLQGLGAAEPEIAQFF